MPTPASTPTSPTSATSSDEPPAPLKNGYILKRDGRYRIDREHVEVDLWTLQDLIARAVTAPLDLRISLLRQAGDLYVGPLAQGCDYDWIEAHRERARQHASEAHLVLAESVLPDDPQAASDILERAIRLDRYNEGLYRTAMKARHRLGDDDGIRTLLRALTSAMSDLDAEPDETTLQLVEELRRQPPESLCPDRSVQPGDTYRAPADTSTGALRCRLPPLGCVRDQWARLSSSPF